MSFESGYREDSCQNCKFRNYDSWHDESWCDHKPEPEGLCERRVISNVNGRCEYFLKRLTD
jgi:hypothetical protein